MTTQAEYNRFRTHMGETDVIAGLQHDIHSDDTVWDIGANIGLHSCFAAQELSTGQLFCFEPELQTAKRLEENLEINNVHRLSSIHRIALDNQEDTLNLVVESDELGVGTHKIGPAADGDTVETIQASHLIADGRVQQPDVVKIDVEGMEWRVLDGMNSFLNSVRVIYCELHTETDGTEKVHQILQENGFTVEKINDRGDTQHIRATHSDLG